MADTFVALSNATSDGSVIFGRNSDREPNEAQEIRVYPAADHAPGSTVKCTYISIPQVEHTNAVLLSKPFWMWGAEMGVNEHGVVMGNEALFTKVPYETKDCLTGMDLVRLALERSKTAWEAIYKITEMLEIYGQGGNCGFKKSMHCHNSFLIADPYHAWVLETAGKQWVAQKVEGYYAISNVASIGKDWILSSDALIPFALKHGFCKKRDDFHFSRCYSDTVNTALADGRSRQAYISNELYELRGRISLPAAIRILRSHGNTNLPAFNVDRAFFGSTVCMHAGAGPARGLQTVSSMVVHLLKGRTTVWVTGTSAPCTAVYKPVWLDAGFPVEEPAPTGVFDASTMWWRHESLHRTVLRDYAARMAVYIQEQDALESGFIERAAVVAAAASTELRREFSKACFDEADRSTADWLQRILAAPAARSVTFYYRAAWEAINHQAIMDGETVRN